MIRPVKVKQLRANISPNDVQAVGCHLIKAFLGSLMPQIKENMATISIESERSRGCKNVSLCRARVLAIIVAFVAICLCMISFAGVKLILSVPNFRLHFVVLATVKLTSLMLFTLLGDSFQ